jgi:hypothetical protein
MQAPRWVDVDDGLPKLPQLRPSLVVAKPRSLEEKQTLEFKGRVVNLRRVLLAKNLQNAREEARQRNFEVGQEVRDTMDHLLGRDISAALATVRLADGTEVRAMAEQLSNVLVKELNDGNVRTRDQSDVPGPMVEHAAWMKLWREINIEGRLFYHQFMATLRSKLQIKLGKFGSKEREKKLADLQGLWCTICAGKFRETAGDEDFAGDVKPFLVLSEFLAFMKSGSQQWDGRLQMQLADEDGSGSAMSDAVPGWRARVVAQNRLAAEAVRESRPNRQRVGVDGRRLLIDGMSSPVWRNMMANEVQAAKDEQQRHLSSTINARISNQRIESWLTVVKDAVSDDGRLAFDDVSSIMREHVKLNADELQLLRRVWKAIDPECTGSVTVAAFGTFMQLGAAKHVGSSDGSRARVVAEKESRISRSHAANRAMPIGPAPADRTPSKAPSGSLSTDSARTLVKNPEPCSASASAPGQGPTPNASERARAKIGSGTARTKLSQPHKAVRSQAGAPPTSEAGSSRASAETSASPVPQSPITNVSPAARVRSDQPRKSGWANRLR